jgi:hypothetical protein
MDTEGSRTQLGGDQFDAVGVQRQSRELCAE